MLAPSLTPRVCLSPARPDTVPRSHPRRRLSRAASLLFLDIIIFGEDPVGGRRAGKMNSRKQPRIQQKDLDVVAALVKEVRPSSVWLSSAAAGSLDHRAGAHGCPRDEGVACEAVQVRLRDPACLSSARS